MTHQPLDGNLALPSLSIYNAQRYNFLKKRKNMLLVMAVHIGIWCWGTLVCPCPSLLPGGSARSAQYIQR